MNQTQRIKARMRVAQRLGYYYPRHRGKGLFYVGRLGGNHRQGMFDCKFCDGYGYSVANGPEGFEYPECTHCEGTARLKRLYHERAWRRVRFFKTKTARAEFNPGWSRWLKWRDRMLADKSGRPV